MDDRELDRALVDRALCRDDAAWREIFRRHRGAIERVIARAVGVSTASDIEDYFGDFCAALLRNDMHKLRQWEPSRGASLSTWLCLIASRTAIDRRRVHHIGEAGPDDETLLAGVPSTGRADDATVALEERTALRRLITRLSAMEQRFVDLYYFRELDPEEIACAMGVSTNTVYTRKFKVEEKLAALAARAV